MGAAHSSATCLSSPATTNIPRCYLFHRVSKPSSNSSSIPTIYLHLQKPTSNFISQNHYSLKSPCSSSKIVPLSCARVRLMETQEGSASKPVIDFHGIDEELIQKMAYDALVWSSLHGLVVGDKSVQRSGKVPGVGMVHAPFALLPVAFPENHWKSACEVAPVFNELIDRVSLDGNFLQDSLSRTKKVDVFTSRLLDIHSKVLEMNKTEEIRLGLHRSDYMLDEQTKLLLHIEINTISSSFPGLSCLVSDLHRSLLKRYGEHLGLDSKRIPSNTTVNRFADALAKAWTEYNNPRAAVMVVVQPEEHNMYDQHWLCAALKEKHNVTAIRKTLAEIDKEGELLPDGTLLVGGQAIAVVYFRTGYAPTDYPSEAEWRARLLMEQSLAIKCPSISYHLAGTKKIQQELAKPNVLERFLENKEDITKLQKCFAGLWSLDDSDIVKRAIERPELFVMKPQREGGGNNIYGDDVKENLLRLQREGNEEDAAYILMQRIFPIVSPMFLVRNGICHKDHAVSELGVYSAYLRNKDKVIINDQCGYLMRTKVSSSNEGGVAAGFAVLDSMYLT
ncbi:glutathione synthetase, chloroplastic isoform X1 [Hevea brasiliensis]|uniref:glutathione synthetase, chloroplastic isoform X1 n=1 Tax=Hevea brasiliensis TaxID=3981 RepID=UPI0025D06CF7|nr:glutathione synthetase, chloroplastic isoform X1 [Hevea brasiliensis]